MPSPSLNYQELALFIIRILLGTTFMAHGSQKVFGFFSGSGLSGFAQYITSLGVHHFLAYTAAFFEFFGGFFLFFGIAAEIGALMVIPVMIGAIYLVHGPHGFFSQNGGYEYPLNLIVCALVIIIGGPGIFALWDPF